MTFAKNRQRRAFNPQNGISGLWCGIVALPIIAIFASLLASADGFGQGWRFDLLVQLEIYLS
jgi:hypothetical protein